LDGLAIISNGDGTDGFVSLRVDFSGGLPDGVKLFLTFRTSLRRHDIHPNHGREGRVLLGVDLEDLRSSTINVFELERCAERSFSTIHAVNVHEVSTTDGSTPQLNTSFERTSVGVDEHLNTISSLGHFVRETSVLSLNHLEVEILGKGG
jgi:hypothetical protein